MRGTGSSSLSVTMARRFIPACAGNGAQPTASSRRATVHPRVCGERALDLRRDGDGIGSSPRVRGTGAPRLTGVQIVRFIPACAGNGSSGACCTRRSTVHPRVCGERLAVTDLRLTAHGSSPRVRGTATSPAPSACRWRFIPACAGNGPSEPRAAPGASVHPRVCGERGEKWLALFSTAGSSPRVRGTGGRLPSGVRKWRFIPACAGNGHGSERRR